MQWMTLPELRGELERTRPAWATTDVDGVLAHGQLPMLSQDGDRHQEVADEPLRRPNNGWIKIRWPLGYEATMPPALVAD